MSQLVILSCSSVLKPFNLRWHSFAELFQLRHVFGKSPLQCMEQFLQAKCSFCNLTNNIKALMIMVALCNRADHYIFILFLLSSFFSSPNLSGRKLDIYHTLAHDVALVRI